jgi:hypothetical protein
MSTYAPSKKSTGDELFFTELYYQCDVWDQSAAEDADSVANLSAAWSHAQAAA